MAVNGTLDLNGITHTITTDTIEYWYKITDTSTGHDGHLIMEAGAILIFDDAYGAGFQAEGSAITITIDGTANAQCEIKSGNTYPDYRWRLPPSTVLIGATRCIFRNYDGVLTETANWRLTNCPTIQDPYTFATVTQLVNLTGSTLADDVLHEILGQASEEINARLALDEVVIEDATDPALKAICILKAKAGILSRLQLDGTRAGAVTVDGITATENLPAAMQMYESQAEAMLKSYIRNHLPTGTYKYLVQKLNLP